MPLPAADSLPGRHSMPFGAELLADGRVRFNFWAPAHPHIDVQLQDMLLPMQQQSGGWHTLSTDRAAAGSRYRFVLPDGSAVPDPASRFQPQDVHGPSEVIDPDPLSVARPQLAGPTVA
jgi:1,4-alpha-glucan branching enzyme